MSILTGILVVIFAFSLFLFQVVYKGENDAVYIFFGILTYISAALIILCIGHYLAILLP